MKLRELREKMTDELTKLLEEQRERLRSLRFNVAGAQEPKVREIRAIRKTVARIMTLVSERASAEKKAK